MNPKERPKTGLALIVGVAIFAAMTAAAVVVPRMQSPRLHAEHDANLHLERARRLLAQYDIGLTVENAYRSAFDEEWFEVSSEQLDDLLDNPEIDVTGDATEELQAYASLPEIKSLDTGEEEMLKLAYGEERWRQYKRSPPPSRVSGAGMMNKGNSEHTRQLSANAKLLTDALREVSGALNITHGDYSTRQNASAHRLQGVIFQEQAMVIMRNVALMRSQLASLRFAIMRQTADTEALAQNQDIVAASEIDARIAEARNEHDKLAEVTDEKETAVARLQAKVADLDERVAAAVAQSDAAREAMETLEDMGVDFSSASGFAEFKQAYDQQARNYRQALTQAHMLKYGTLDNATIDRSGDYLRGQYVPVDSAREIEIRRGLEHYRHDLERTQAELAKLQDGVARLEESAEAMREFKRNLQQGAERTAQAVTRRITELESDSASLVELDEQIRSEEDQAVSLLTKAAAAFKSAENGVRNEENLAEQDKPSNPELSAYHYSHVAGKQTWRRGQMLAQQADAELRIGMIHLGRYQDARALVHALRSLEVTRDDLPRWEEAAEAAKTEAVARTESAIDILDNKAQNQIGDGNWTVAAEIGAAHYILSLLDVELAAERALEWYKVAVQDREQQARVHAVMRDYIASRTRKSRQ